MAYIDLRNLGESTKIKTDVCIIGSGPAGSTLARELLESGLDVCVVEAGGISKDPDTQALYEIENVGHQRRGPQELMRQRILGGSSTTWSGRCAPFDAIDFSERAWIPHSGWPLNQEDMDPYWARAQGHLGLGSHCYDSELFDLLGTGRPHPEIDASALKPVFWQFSSSEAHGGAPVIFGQDVVNAGANVRVFLHSNLVHINTDSSGSRLESLDFQSLTNQKMRIEAKTAVLCCGGIENARLLLASNNCAKAGVGNQNDMVGRFLMDHVGAVIASFDPRRSRAVQDRFGSYWLTENGSRHRYLHGVSLADTVQTQEGLLNAACFLEEYVARDDPWEALKRVVARARDKTSDGSIKPAENHMFWREDDATGETAQAPSLGGDLASVLRHIPSLASNLRRKYLNNRPPLSRNKRVDLYALIEQPPNPDSRITLSESRDSLGMPLSRINWVIGERERQTAKRLGELVAREFPRLGLVQPDLADWLHAGENWRENFTDRAHPTGATRMSEDPKHGVVDTNCQVHGVEGLYVSGSSVFPTSGHANPTLMIVALAVRLADWLKQQDAQLTNEEHSV